MAQQLERPSAQPHNLARAVPRAEPVPRGSPATSLNARQRGQGGRQIAGCSRLRALWVALLVAESDHRDSASSLGPVAARRSAAYAAPESSFAHSHLPRMTALPSRAAVPRKPMCRQTLGGAAVPRPSILLPTLPAAFSDFSALSHSQRAHRDEHCRDHWPDDIAGCRSRDSGTKSLVSSCGSDDRSRFDCLVASSTKSALAAGATGDDTEAERASTRMATR